MEDFKPFPKIPRLNRDVTITEKIDGTNASLWIEQVLPSDGNDDYPWITHDGIVYRFRTASRKRFVTPLADNFGFAKWAYDHAHELVAGLGEGVHFGEWWGKGIQRNYGMNEKVFSLFNTKRWMSVPHAESGQPITDVKTGKIQHVAPHCCNVVPVLYEGPFDLEIVDDAMNALLDWGSAAVPMWKPAEGVVVYHQAANMCFKRTFEGDALGKERSA